MCVRVCACVCEGVGVGVGVGGYCCEYDRNSRVELLERRVEIDCVPGTVEMGEEYKHSWGHPLINTEMALRQMESGYVLHTRALVGWHLAYCVSFIFNWLQTPTSETGFRHTPSHTTTAAGHVAVPWRLGIRRLC